MAVARHADVFKTFSRLGYSLGSQSAVNSLVPLHSTSSVGTSVSTRSITTAARPTLGIFATPSTVDFTIPSLHKNGKGPGTLTCQRTSLHSRVGGKVMGPWLHSSLNHAQVDAIPLTTYDCEKGAIEDIFSKQSKDKERAFFVKDAGIVERQYKRWVNNLPTVRPFYAVKCNPDDTLLRLLAAMNAGFDCASGEEMAACLRMGVSPDDIIFANPIKSQKDLKYAASVGVKKMTFDNEAELYKIKEFHPDCQLVLRLLPDDSGSVMRFGVKFGAPYVHIESLLKTAKALDLKVIGTSFHIGSGCFDANSYEKAIALSREVHDMAPRLGLEKFTIMDIGGGFPGNPVENQRTGETPAFEEFAGVIRESIAKHFPPGCGVELIAEPGRYMATAWTTLFTMVQGKREEPASPEATKRRFLYYINDGVYGSFNCIMFDHAEPEPVPAYRFMADKLNIEKDMKSPHFTMDQANNQSLAEIAAAASATAAKFANGLSARAIHLARGRDPNCEGTFFGPTCDSMDVVAKNYPVEELFVGDWLAFPAMGAYTNAAASTFNGMPKPTVHYCRSRNPSPDAE